MRKQTAQTVMSLSVHCRASHCRACPWPAAALHLRTVPLPLHPFACFSDRSADLDSKLLPQILVLPFEVVILVRTGGDLLFQLLHPPLQLVPLLLQPQNLQPRLPAQQDTQTNLMVSTCSNAYHPLRVTCSSRRLRCSCLRRRDLRADSRFDRILHTAAFGATARQSTG